MGLLARHGSPSKTIRIIPLTPTDTQARQTPIIRGLVEMSPKSSFLLPEVLISRWTAIP